MAAPAAVLAIAVRANTKQANAGLMRLQGQLRATAVTAERSSSRTSKATAAMGTAMKTVGKGGALALAVGVGFAVKKAADFEAQMSSLASVTNATGREMKRLEKDALSAGAATKFSALDAAKAQTELAKGGLSVAQISRGGLKAALALAAAGELDLADAAETTANAMNLFGLRGRDAMKVADMLATAANATTADVGDFSLALKQGGSVAKTAGLSMRQTVLILEALAKAGIRGSDAGTSLKTALIQLIKPTAKQQALADKLGLSFIDASGNMKSAAAISAMLRDRLGGMTKAQRTATLATLAGTDGVRTLTSLYDAGPARLKKWEKGLGKSGTAAAVAAKKQDNLKGALENLQGSFETLAIKAGSALLPTLTDGAQALTKFLNQMGTGEGAGAQVTKTLDSLRKAVGLSADDWRQFGKAIATVWSFVGPLIGRQLKGIIQMLRGFAQVFGGIIKVLTGILTLDFGMAWDGVKQIFQGTFNALLGWLRQMTAPMRQTIAVIGSALSGPFKAAWGVVRGLFVAGFNAIKAFVIAATGPQRAVIQAFANAMSAPIRFAWRVIRGLFRSGLAAAMAVFRRQTAVAGAVARLMGKLIAGPLRAAWKVISGVFRAGVSVAIRHTRALSGAVGVAKRIGVQMTVPLRAAWETIKALFRTGAKVAGGSIHQFGRGIKRVVGAIQRIFTALGQTVGSIADFIKDAVNKIVSALGKVKDKISGAVPKVPGFPNLPGIPGIQKGGMIRKGKKSGDSVPAMLERGEYVLNRNAVQKVGARRLDAINYGAAPRFQQGGIVALGRKLERRGYEVGEHPAFGGVHPVHVQGSYHYKGQALDVNDDQRPFASGSGEPGSLDRLYRQLKGRSGIVELLWRVANHFDHLHVAMAGKGNLGGLGGAATQIPRTKITGTGLGPDIARGAEARMRGAANARLAELAPADIGQASVKGFGAGAQENRRLGKRMAEAFSGWGHGRNWAALDHLWGVDESGWRESVANFAGSGAYGIAQALPASKYPPAGRPGAPDGIRKARAQIGWGLRYIKGHYGNPIAADAFRHANNFYRLGGLVGMQSGGGTSHGGVQAPAGTGVGGGSGTPKTGGLKIGQGETGTKLLKRLQAGLKLYEQGHPLKAGRAISAALGKVKQVGLTKAVEGQLTGLTNSAGAFGSFGERAGTLSGDTGTAKVFGLTEAEWIQKQLTTLFVLRNLLIRVHEVLAAKQQAMAVLVTAMKAKLTNLNKRLTAVNKTKPKTKAGKKHKKAVVKHLTRARNAVKGRILPALGDRRSKLGERDSTIMEDIARVQGDFGSMKVMKTLPAIGVFGGEIFDAQNRLRELGTSTAATATDPSGRVESINELLREQLQTANLRTAVSEAAFSTLQNFAGGGIVQAPRGAARMAVVHGREGVFTPDQMAAMGGGASVQVFVHPGGTGADVKVNGEWVRAEVRKALRHEANQVGRAPGIAGRI